jgi:hypothetical protein
MQKLQKQVTSLDSTTVLPVKPFFNTVQEQKCIKFAQDHLRWTIANWKKVIWSDKLSFEIGKNLQVFQVWQTNQEKYKPECLQPTFKSGQTSTMVWGALFGTTKAPLIFLSPESQKAADFIEEVYKPGLIPFLNKYNPDCS